VIPTNVVTGVPFERDTLGSRITDFAVLDSSRRGFPPKEAGRMGEVKLWGGSGPKYDNLQDLIPVSYGTVSIQNQTGPKHSIL